MPSVGREGQFSLPLQCWVTGLSSMFLSAVENRGPGCNVLKVGTDGSISSVTSGIALSAPSLVEGEQGAEMEREVEGQVGGGAGKFTVLLEQAWDQ